MDPSRNGLATFCIDRQQPRRIWIYRRTAAQILRKMPTSCTICGLVNRSTEKVEVALAPMNARHRPRTCLTR